VEEAVRGEPLPVDLLLVLDASASMNYYAAPGVGTRWELVQQALIDFARDARSAGLGVGFQTFPFTTHEKSCSTDADCNGDAGDCSPTFLCYGTGVLPATARTCDPARPICPQAGTACVPSGRCSSSFARCVGLGQPCPGGGDDVCETAPLICRLPIDSCSADDYESPRCPSACCRGRFPPSRARLSQVRPAGSTPLAPALEGAARYLRRHLMSHPGAGAPWWWPPTPRPSAATRTRTSSRWRGVVEAARMGNPGADDLRDRARSARATRSTPPRPDASRRWAAAEARC
jgi:hypothetical protein